MPLQFPCFRKCVKKTYYTMRGLHNHRKPKRVENRMLNSSLTEDEGINLMNGHKRTLLNKTLPIGLKKRLLLLNFNY